MCTERPQAPLFDPTPTDFDDGTWAKGETITLEAQRPDYGIAKLAGELVPASLGIGVTIIVLAVAVRAAMLILSL
jgi:hypothetical protein